ncbi:MAG: GGDEF domain-containing protein [Deltaproteobacteria bacterium]|nr:GGDEF domain-containing protein [Deltaproteobacteria bacterium]
MTKTNAQLTEPCHSALLYQNFLHFSQELWSGGSPEGLLYAFFRLLKEAFGIRKMACLDVSFRGGVHTFRSNLTVSERFSEADRLSQEKIQLFQSQLDLTEHSPEAKSTCFWQMNCQKQEIQWTLLGSPKEGTLCLWERPPSAPDTDIFSMCLHMLQHESLWFSKLDKTKALLYLDDLTGLYNYRYLETALECEIRRADRYQQNFCLLFIDLDNFKQVNDQHGHPVGSQILRQTGHVLQEELREVDTVIRYGGDEYVVILLGAGCESGRLVAERIRRRISGHPFQTEGVGPLSISCSIGIACFPEHGNSKETLLKVADDTMYQSKRQGKNQVVLSGGQNIISKDHLPELSRIS